MTFRLKERLKLKFFNYVAEASRSDWNDLAGAFHPSEMERAMPLFS